MTARHMKQVPVRADGKKLALSALPLITSVVGAVVMLLVTHEARLALLPLSLALPSACLLLATAGDTHAQWDQVYFPALLLCASIGYAVTFPPATVPDEPSHARVAYVYANLVTPGYEPSTLRAEEAAFLHNELINHPDVTAERWRDIAEARPLISADRTKVTDDDLVGYDLWGNDPEGHDLAYLIGSSPFYEKIGCVFGILVARILNLNAWATFYLGRICNVLYCCAIIALAVRLTPIGKEAFMAVSLLPMTLHEIGSYSYDGAIIALCLLTTALLLKSVCAHGPMTRCEAVPLFVSLFLLGPCKMVYSLVAVIGLLIPANRFVDRRHEVLFKLGLIAAPVAGVFTMSWQKVARIVMGAQSSGPISQAPAHRGSDVGTFYTVSDVIGNPLGTIQIMLHTLAIGWRGYLIGMLGCALGWFQRDIMNRGLAIWLLLLLLLSSVPQASDEDDGAITSAEEGETRSIDLLRFVGPVLFVLLVGAIMLGEMLTWTFNTEVIIHGVQGRYFLPMLPLLLLPLCWLKPVPRIVNQLTVFAFCFVDVVYLVSIIAALL